MTGYVIINKNILSGDEFDVYSGYYCGICKSIGRRFGQIPRLALSYDSVFLAMLLSSLTGEDVNIEYEHCALHHIKKKPVIKNDDAVDYAADMLLILAYYNFLDDKNDEHRIRGSLGVGILKSAYGKLEKKYPGICQEVEDNISKLARLEKENSGSLDLTCEAFGNVMRPIFSGFQNRSFETESNIESTDISKKNSVEPRLEKRINDSMETRILGELGFNIGKWIYLMDALDDLEKDRKSGSYNPLIYRERGTCGVDDLLYNYLGQISNAIDLLEIRKNKGIIENVIWNGLRARTESLLMGEDQDKLDKNKSSNNRN